MLTIKGTYSGEERMLQWLIPPSLGQARIGGILSYNTP